MVVTVEGVDANILTVVEKSEARRKGALNNCRSDSLPDRLQGVFTVQYVGNNTVSKLIAGPAADCRSPCVAAFEGHCVGPI